MKKKILYSLITVLFVCSAFLSACQSKAATIASTAAPAAAAMDDWLGPYAPERLWGNPREATNKSDGWSFSYTNAITKPYKTGEDGIAALTDKEMNALITWAFYTPGQKYLTERLYGANNAEGEYGETILEDRVFKENTPTHSYMKYIYRYPYQADFSETTIEYAKLDGRSVVAQLTVIGLEKAASSLIVVPEIISRTGDRVVQSDSKTYAAAFDGGVLAIVSETEPQSWQISANKYPTRAAINASIIQNQVLSDAGSGNKAAWEFKMDLTPGKTQTMRFGIGYAENSDLAVQRAKTALAKAEETLTTRKTEADALYKNDVSAHREVYQAALMSLLWNKMYYQYNGSYQSQFLGKINIQDVVLVPDKWEFPWPAMWDTCFQAKVATLADIQLAKQDISLYLSDRWQTSTGHVPNTEWDLIGETPPLFAWAAWQVYQKDSDRSFLETVFPPLEKQYAYILKAFDLDRDHLFKGGFMGMDNLPRPGNPDEEDADMSGWMAFFASYMQKIAVEIGNTDRAAYYGEQYTQIAAAINAQLWDADSGFYYDRNVKGLLKEKSYSGLIPFIAGVSSPAQNKQILASLSDPAELWSDYGVRSLSAQSKLFESGYSTSGWKNSNWRGPVWLPINYLLVQQVETVDPDLGGQLRSHLIDNVEKNWQQSGRFYEYYDSETGQGIGADHQTGWTALVANLIYEKYHK
jgi:hypothetical protein